MLCDFTPSCIFQGLNGAQIISILTINKVKNLTRNFSKIRLYTIFVYVHMIWGDILSDCDNHTRSIIQFKYRLYQSLSKVFSSVWNSLKIQHYNRTGLELLSGIELIFWPCQKSFGPQEQLCSYHEGQQQPEREALLKYIRKNYRLTAYERVFELLTISLALAVLLFTKTCISSYWVSK